MIVEMVVRFRRAANSCFRTCWPTRYHGGLSVNVATSFSWNNEHFVQYVLNTIVVLSSAKGSSPSTASNLLWRRSMPYLIAGGLHFACHFALSRKNRADCPYHALDGWRYQTVLWARVAGITRGGTRPCGRGRRGEPEWRLGMRGRLRCSMNSGGSLARLNCDPSSMTNVARTTP